MTRDCPFCLSVVAIKATRCPHCTSGLATAKVESKGLFAGMSLSGASLDPDSDANQLLDGKAVSSRDIVLAEI